MARFLALFKGWPIAARVVSGVLAAVVAGFGINTATSGGSTHPASAPSPGTTTTLAIQFPTPTDVSTSTSAGPASTSSTSTTKPSSSTTANASVVRSGNVTTTATTRPNSSTTTTTTTTPPAQNSYCRATLSNSVSNANPPPGSTETVNVSTTAPAGTQVWINVYSQTANAGRTNAQGASPPYTFTVRSAQQSGSPVVVAVYLGATEPTPGQADNCETHFTPTS